MDAQELLSILPHASRLPTIIKDIILLAYGAVCLSLICFTFDVSIIQALPIILIIAILSILFVPIMFISNKLYPLVFSTKGIVLYPYIAEYWSDIIGFGWQSYAQISGLPLQSYKEKHVLFIANKGSIFRQRNLARGLRSIMGYHHLYPTEQQQKEIEKIFSDHGIRKFDNPLDAIDSQ